MALNGYGDRGPGRSLDPVAEEQAARVRDTAQTVLRHLEQPGLASRAETMLDGPQRPQRQVAIAFETENGVYKMLQGPGPASTPSLVTWPTSTSAAPNAFVWATKF